MVTKKSKEEIISEDHDSIITLQSNYKYIYDDLEKLQKSYEDFKTIMYLKFDALNLKMEAIILNLSTFTSTHKGEQNIEQKVSDKKWTLIGILSANILGLVAILLRIFYK